MQRHKGLRIPKIEVFQKLKLILNPQRKMSYLHRSVPIQAKKLPYFLANRFQCQKCDS